MTAACDGAKIPVYVINLKESVTRREHMKREMKSAGISFTFIEAVKGSEITETIGTVSRNETACALSHLHAIRLIAEGDHAFGAVFEDDVLVSADARTFLDRKVLQAMPRFDVLQLMFLPKSNGISVRIARVGAYGLQARQRPYLGMQAIVYSKAAAKRIVSEITEVSSQIDDMLFRRVDLFGLRVAAIVPAVVQLADFPSTICPPKIPGIRNKALRELKRARVWLRMTASFAVAWTVS